jgi:hypothetical protein
VDARNTRNGIEVSEAATALNLAMRKVDDIVMILQVNYVFLILFTFG